MQVKFNANGKRRGITLVELLVTLTVVSLLAGAGLPRLFEWLQKWRAEANVSEFLALIQTARTTAIVQNVNVTLCPGDQSGCRGRNTWHEGSTAFIDYNGNRRRDGRDTAIASLPAIRQMRIYWRAFRNRGYLRFTGTGLTDWQNGHFLFCPQPVDNRLARMVVLNYAGRTYRTRDRDRDGIHENVRGVPLSCPT